MEDGGILYNVLHYFRTEKKLFPAVQPKDRSVSLIYMKLIAEQNMPKP
jgi:hypothetical protein